MTHIFCQVKLNKIFLSIRDVINQLGPFELFRYQNSKRFQKKFLNPCLFYDNSDKAPKLITTTVDDFLVLTTTEGHIEIFYKTLTATYTIKLQKQTTEFIRWSVMYVPFDIIHLSEPELFIATLLNADMEKSNPLCPSYQNDQAVPVQPSL